MRTLLALLCLATSTVAAEWQTLPATGSPNVRHEAAFVAVGERLVLLGGRRIQPVDVFDPATATWTHGKAPEIEIHHFQPVVRDGKVWLVGAMSGRYPYERPLDHIPIYDPATDTWSRGPEVPTDRRRGGAGAVIHGDTLYVVCGITNGHWDGHVAWLDALDLKTGQWRRLPDAPRPRDHFQAAIIGDKLYAVGGRRSSAATKETFNLVISEVDVFDLKTGTWSTLPASSNLPTPRAGSMTHAHGPWLIVIGGESHTQQAAHAEVEALDTRSGEWKTWPALQRGRHGTGLAQIGNRLYTASGSGNRGGGPELDSVEAATLP